MKPPTVINITLHLDTGEWEEKLAALEPRVARIEAALRSLRDSILEDTDDPETLFGLPVVEGEDLTAYIHKVSITREPSGE